MIVRTSVIMSMPVIVVVIVMMRMIVMLPLIVAMRMTRILPVVMYLAICRRRARQTSRIRGVGHVNSWFLDSCYPAFKTL